MSGVMRKTCWPNLLATTATGVIRWKGLTVCAVVFLTVLTSPAFAQSPDRSVSPGGGAPNATNSSAADIDPDAPEPDPDAEKSVLGLDDAERIAESNNFDLRVLNMERDIAEDAIDARLAARAAA